MRNTQGNCIYVLLLILVIPWWGHAMMVTIVSKQFNNNDTIPVEFTCDGENSSPAVWWHGVPSSARSLTLVCEDPDAPGGTWDHWIVFNIPSHVTMIQKSARAKDIPARYGTNSWGKPAYGGPCPPSGTHRYVFTLYALDSELSLTANAAKKDILGAMQGHIIQRAQIIGTYQRKK